MKARQNVFFGWSVITTFLLPLSVHGAQREVGAGQTYSSIQNAINAAASNDVVNVHAGTYTGSLVVNKPLTIKANAGDNPVVVGRIDVEASNVTITGLEITKWTGSAAGITILNRTNVTVSYCKIHAGTGLGETSIDVNGVTTEVGAGVYTRNCGNVLLDHLDIYGNIDGIKITSGHSSAGKDLAGNFATGIRVTNCSIHDCVNDGISMSGQYITISDSWIRDCLSLKGNPADGSGWHSDGVQFVRNSGTTGTSSADGYQNVQHARILRNTFGNTTQNIFVQGPSPGTENSSNILRDILVANNVCYMTPGTLVHGKDPADVAGKGFSGGASTAAECLVYNNTMINCGPGLDGVSTYKNNIVKGAPSYGATFGAGAVADYNLYYGNKGANVYLKTSGTRYSLIGTDKPSGMEANSVAAKDPKVGPIPRPNLQPDSAAIGVGVSLSAPCLADRDGLLRSTAERWDIGAYAVQKQTLAPPTGLTVIK